MAASALGLAAPAFAHPDDGDNGADETFAAATYQDFSPMYQHIWQGIQHGMSDGSYTRWQGRRFYRELQGIRARAIWEERSDNYDPEDINARLQSLHERMHIAHDAGHERLDRQNNEWNNPDRGNGYGYRSW